MKERWGERDQLRKASLKTYVFSCLLIINREGARIDGAPPEAGSISLEPL